ncbi:hypothetical protein CSX12_18065 [Microbacterium sp. Y-01]|uniref:hypothetical protein n=1 Tax=Microbacterium sp. Y-01 TaxID=2048898 RepID=UPI000F5F372C|nr:hypothetical protein [Microbacterium sp. Y-01]AZH80215.1 hypothetical protein CSX12_18065 [Microbacterium sp. Y-01]
MNIDTPTPVVPGGGGAQGPGGLAVTGGSADGTLLGVAALLIALGIALRLGRRAAQARRTAATVAGQDSKR